MSKLSTLLLAVALLLLFQQFVLVQGRSKNKKLDGPQLVPKQLAGPPVEFPFNQLPLPIQGALTTSSAMLAVVAQESIFHPGKAEVAVDVIVDSHDMFSFSVLADPSIQPGDIEIRLFNPFGFPVGLAHHATPSQLQIGSEQVNTTTYIFVKPLVGTYKLHLIFSNFKRVARDYPGRLNSFAKRASNYVKDTDQVTAVVYVDNESPIKIFSHVNTYHQLKSSSIGLVANLYDSSLYTDDFLRANPKFRPPALIFDPSEQVNVELMMILPNGTVQTVPMVDDGVHEDEYANDGVYGASIDALTDGFYVARSRFDVDTASLSDRSSINHGSDYWGNSKKLMRSAQHILAVVDGTIELLPTALADIDTNQTYVDVLLNVKVSSDEDRIFRVYAEVWGANASDASQQIPIAWLSTLTVVEFPANNTQLPYLRLRLDRRWLVFSKAALPLVLQNVVIQDLDNQAIVSNQTLMTVTFLNDQGYDLDAFSRSVPEYDGESINEEMRKGKRPERFARDAATPAKLMMVHGYCAGTNPFQNASADFTDAVYFLSPNADDSNDDFARKLVAFAESEGLTSYSAIAHSQGGMAITHLRNYYWSGLDVPTQGRPLQSVSTPYLGAALAGNLAGLGKAVGIGCGANYDLSPDGAPLWLSGISADSLDDVYYYYVQYGTSPAYCNSAVNMFISKPNDGTTEVKYAQPAGAHFAGFNTGECHITGMQYPAVCMNHTRNNEMNGLAARN